jgi:hypothetical protein
MSDQSTTRKCTRCGRTLRDAKSVALGRGPVCDRKAKAELAASTAQPAQLDKAQQLLADGAVEVLRPGRVWLVVSSKGGEVYRTAPAACTCPAGVRGRECYHRLAVSSLAA